MGRPPVILCFKCDICGEQYRVLDKHKCKKQKRRMNMKGYVSHTEVTKEILDTIKVGDLIKVNDWKKPMRVKGVSENYAVMIEKQFGKLYYSVIEKKPWDGVRHNEMIGGYFHCGRDNWIFSDLNFDYKFDNVEAIARYLSTFESGETELSVRNAIPITQIHVKRAGLLAESQPIQKEQDQRR